MITQEVVEAFMESRELRQIAARSIEAYEWALSKLLAVFPDQRPSRPNDIQKIFTRFSSLAPESRKSLWNRLKTFFLWLANETGLPHLMASIPAPRSRRKLPRTLSEGEITHLLTSIDNERNYSIFALLLDTGIRLGELASIKLSPSPLAEAAYWYQERRAIESCQYHQVSMIWLRGRATKKASGKLATASRVTWALGVCRPWSNDR